MKFESLEEHSEQHLSFLQFWSDEVLQPFKAETVHTEETFDKLSFFYNYIIKHIGEEYLPTYGSEAIEVEMTRHELGRLSMTNLPMSSFMPGAFDTVKMLDPHVADFVDTSHLTPRALTQMADLNLVSGMSQVLGGQIGSLRDRFVSHTLGDQTPEPEMRAMHLS